MRVLGEQLQRIIAVQVRRYDQHERFPANDLRRQFLGQLKRRLDQDRQVHFSRVDLTQQVQ
ncbi:hypothetical protein D3C73_1220650 [compost metagenome]